MASPRRGNLKGKIRIGTGKRKENVLYTPGLLTFLSEALELLEWNIVKAVKGERRVLLQLTFYCPLLWLIRGGNGGST